MSTLFYPLFGENKVDIITYNQPYDFKEKGQIEKFIISVFSEGSNIDYRQSIHGEKIKIKIPFTLSKQEIMRYSQLDLRQGRIWTVV